MASNKENQLIELISSPIIKVVGTVFLMGVAWARLEYKVDQRFDELVTIIKVNAATDFEQKKSYDKEISELRAKIEKMEDKAQEYFKTEYLRPEEPKLKRYRE